MKGAEKVINTLFISLFALGLLTVIILFLVNYFTQTNSIIKTSDIDRHSIALGNLYLSSDKLVYTNGNTLYRDVLSTEKLDKEMISPLNLATYVNIFSDSDLFKELSFPNSIVTIYVHDYETGGDWFLLGHGSAQTAGFSYAEIEQCLINKFKLNPQTIGRLFIAQSSAVSPQEKLLSIFDQYDIKECASSYSQTGYSIKDFPVAIQTPNGDVHEGILFVVLQEL
jgi:hypothetical protein